MKPASIHFDFYIIVLPTSICHLFGKFPLNMIGSTRTSLDLLDCYNKYFTFPRLAWHKIKIIACKSTERAQ